jgi:DMSO/TMAO reductase YedYZ molybdopterin-dependent catalytic subunit
MNRKLFLAASVSGALAACSPLGTKLNDNARFNRFLGSVQTLDELVIGTRGRAKLYAPSDVSSDFPIDSLETPGDAHYRRLAADGFRSYQLIVDGAVDRPQRLSPAHLQAIARVRQITRHDCVEGWSAIVQWEGVRLSDVLAMAQPQAQARFAVFHSFDVDSGGTPYYESLSLPQAAHPQTILALRQNGAPITPDHGAPVRLVVPTQLGYKSAKWLQRIEIVATMSKMGGGKGGYWEDQGYEWYAGI